MPSSKYATLCAPGSEVECGACVCGQAGGVPFVRAKLPLDHHPRGAACSLRLEARGAQCVAFWRPAAAGAWRPVGRGCGWLEAAELACGQARGSLPPGDPRGEAAAACTLPAGGWSAVLGTEQWEHPAALVTFSEVAAADNI